MVWFSIWQFFYYLFIMVWLSILVSHPVFQSIGNWLNILSHTAWVWIPTPPHISCAILGDSLKLITALCLNFPIYKMGVILELIKLVWGLNELIHVNLEQWLAHKKCSPNVNCYHYDGVRLWRALYSRQRNNVGSGPAWFLASTPPHSIFWGSTNPLATSSALPQTLGQRDLSTLGFCLGSPLMSQFWLLKSLPFLLCLLWGSLT